MMEREIRVGSGGFVRYVGHYGSDEGIVATARVSTGRGFVSWDPYIRCKDCKSTISGLDPAGPWEYGKSGCSHDNIEKFPRGDYGLICYLMENHHTSPIEFGVIHFHLRLPMDIWRHLVLHRTASVQEYSTRYSEAIDEASVTDPDKWRLQGKSNRQGSSEECLQKGTSDDKFGYYFSQQERELQELSRQIYEERLEAGIAKEQARKDLPLSTYTEVHWLLDCHNLFHALGLRLEGHALLETRQMADGIASIVKELFPRLYSAFEEYKLYSVTFSRTEISILRELCSKLGNGFVHPLFEATEKRFSKAQRERFLGKIGVKI